MSITKITLFKLKLINIHCKYTLTLEFWSSSNIIDYKTIQKINPKRFNYHISTTVYSLKVHKKKKFTFIEDTKIHKYLSKHPRTLNFFISPTILNNIQIFIFEIHNITNNYLFHLLLSLLQYISHEYYCHVVI